MAEQNQAASALVGVVLDVRYRIDGLLGEGGMGAVYSATDLRLDKPVAVKVMARSPCMVADLVPRVFQGPPVQDQSRLDTTSAAKGTT